MSLAVLAFVLASPAGALELRIAAWNLEHLADTNEEGCVGRDDNDYDALARSSGGYACVDGVQLIVFGRYSSNHEAISKAMM